MASHWIKILMIVALCAAAVGAFAPRSACADSWAMPETETIESANGRYRFTVEPTPIGSQLQYFAEEVDALQNDAGVERPAPFGLLERKADGGSWEPVWAVALENHVAPVSVLVSDDGRYVVTFDNWHSVGHGDNVIVIYGPDGGLVRSMPLTELVPPTYKDALPHTVSSLRWKRDAAITSDSRMLAIDVLVPQSDFNKEEPDSIRFVLLLEDGSVTPPGDSEWQAAQCAAEQVHEERERIEQERLAYLRNPLRAPVGCEMGEWHEYLRESFARVTPDWLDDPFTSTTVLFAPDHPRHDESVGWLRERMLESYGSKRSEAFVSPCEPDALIEAVAAILRRVEPGSLAEATLYVSIPRSHLERLTALIEPSGARLIWLDPQASIPQRAERVPGSATKDAADEERTRRSMREMDAMMEELEGL